MKLFKYREINDRTKGLIVRNEVYFPSAVELDDILDCGINVEFSAANPTAYRQLLRVVLRDHLKPSDQFDAIVERHYREQTQNIGKLVQDATAGCLHATRTNKGVFSMSESPTIPEMWRLYAGDHQGVCLEFSAPE